MCRDFNIAGSRQKLPLSGCVLPATLWGYSGDSLVKDRWQNLTVISTEKFKLCVFKEIKIIICSPKPLSPKSDGTKFLLVTSMPYNTDLS